MAAVKTVERIRKPPATTPPVLIGADRDWGYLFGCDGTLTDTEAAEYLKVSRNWVWRLGCQGKIRRGKDQSGRWYYCQRSLAEYRKVKEFGPGL
jgi:hypothetical protein